jgi:hypothetical protein
MGAGLGVASVASTARGTAALDGDRQGLASGLLATSAQVGTALGLAVVVPVAAARSAALGGDPQAQVAGYELGFLLAAALACAAAPAIAWARAPRAFRTAFGSQGRTTTSGLDRASPSRTAAGRSSSPGRRSERAAACRS